MNTLSPENILRLAGERNSSDDELFVLADQACLIGLEKRLFSCGCQWRNLFAQSREAGAAAAGPVLFRITVPAPSNERWLLRWISSEGKYSSCLLLVLSPLTLDELAARLRYRFDAMLPDAVPILLRYFDGRIFEALVQHLSHEQLKCFLGVGPCWWYVDRVGTLKKVHAEFMKDSADVPLVLSVSQEASLIDACEPDQVAEMLKNVVPNEYNELDESQRFEFLTRHMEAARRTGIVGTQELALYCALALMEGQAFASRENWPSILKEVAAGGILLSDAVMNTTEFF